MGTPESKVKQFIDNLMKKWYPEAFRYAPPGIGYFGRNGMPDRMWIIGSKELSVVVAIEAKTIGNQVPTELQRRTLISLARQGAVAAVVVGKDIDHMERIRNEIDRRLRLSIEEPRTQGVRQSDTNNIIPS
jgi:hypothetical protein